ncbi:MAG TPA: gliding motility-associated ABC transporter ATP-binding subunit GldA [Chitinophagaceae bacterium]|nr:gliding motility-associated ABC transporter ATP-binding subunit GldA [Chitinophagaceae bacterium]HAN39259.1 gliding motility-associated ABC transporter ATP-binding subunit GldA [Chitinophagaceae bacterium]
MSIIVQQLRKTYGSQIAVNDISFSIQPGEIVGFLGPNGAGKSTTMKMITGYLAPSAGSIQVCGLPMHIDNTAAKAKIGYLAEANPLYYDMYVKEYLQFIAQVFKVSQASKAVADVIELTGLGIEQHKKKGQLSKGYKQRVGLAAALIHQPEVLILDEPTTGLDPNQIIEIRNLIKSQGQHKTVLFSSHIMQEVQAVCNRVIIINKGQIVADDSLHNLQGNHQKNQVSVVFKESLEAEWLQRLPAVQSVSKKDNVTWQLQTADTTAAKKQVMELALAQDLNIVSLQTGGNNLEEIFRSLTASNQ